VTKEPSVEERRILESYDEHDALEQRWNLAPHNEIESAVHRPLPTDVAAAMRAGVPPVPMLLEGWLVEGDLHWVHADAEALKTWVGLRLSLWLMEAGHRVVWFDEELGLEELVRRLHALGAEPDVIEARFAYYPFPSWNMEREHVAGHAFILQRIQPALVVYDTATDMLVSAELDENSGVDVTRWVKDYPEQARRLGITQLVLDHTGKQAERGAVGSRAKRAKAKVQYYLKVIEPSDATTAGKLEITREKNTRGAPLPKRRIFIAGGTPFQFEETEDTRSKESKLRKREQIWSAIVSTLQAHPGHSLSTNQLYQLVGETRPCSARYWASGRGSRTSSASRPLPASAARFSTAGRVRPSYPRDELRSHCAERPLRRVALNLGAALHFPAEGDTRAVAPGRKGKRVLEETDHAHSPSTHISEVPGFLGAQDQIVHCVGQ
jgi:hypothetical protein